MGYGGESAALPCGHEKLLMDSKLCLKVTWWPGAPHPCSLLLAQRVSSDTEFSTSSMLATKTHYLFSESWFPSKGKFTGKCVSVTLQAGEGQVVESWQDFSSPASGNKISRTKPGQAGRRQREVGRKAAPGWAKCRQPAGISTSSSREWDLVLALVLILLCEESQSCFFSECVRKAIKSYGRAASRQTLRVQSHKCYGAPVISTSSRTSSVTAGWAPHTRHSSFGRWPTQHQAGLRVQQLWSVPC